MMRPLKERCGSECVGIKQSHELKISQTTAHVEIPSFFWEKTGGAYTHVRMHTKNYNNMEVKQTPFNRMKTGILYPIKGQTEN